MIFITQSYFSYKKDSEYIWNWFIKGPFCKSLCVIYLFAVGIQKMHSLDLELFTYIKKTLLSFGSCVRTRLPMSKMFSLMLV